MVSERELVDLRAQVTRLQADSTAELLKHREQLAERDRRIAELEGGGEMAQYLTDARDFSSHTFGFGKRTGGVTQHIEKELAEIREKPDDLTEWVDVIILACDGYWRHGGQPENLMADIRAKLEKNKRRVWPTPTSEDVAVEHDRTHDDPLNPELGPEHREYWVRKTDSALAGKGVNRG